MARPPSQKGTSVLPVVLALKQHPDREQLVPKSLWKYFDEPVLVSDWYPEADYWQLIAALVRTIDPKTAGGDVWRYFARFSAQRDIGGQAVKAAAAHRPESAGIYKSFATVDDVTPARFFERAVRLWSLYHDTGHIEVVGARHARNAVVMRLCDFVIPIEGFVRLQGYYLEEYGALVGISVKSRVIRSTASGDDLCEWEHRLSRTDATRAYLASLPEVAPA